MKELVSATGKAPGLAVVLVGARGDSETYVRSKVKACEEVGIESYASYLPEDVSQEELLKVRRGRGCSCFFGERGTTFILDERVQGERTKNPNKMKMRSLYFRPRS